MLFHELIWYIKVAIIVAAVIAVLYIILRQLGVGIPGWLVQIFWICVAAAVGLFAITFLVKLL